MIVVLITMVKLHRSCPPSVRQRSASSRADYLQRGVKSFRRRFGSTAAGVGILIALGAMFADLLATPVVPMSSSTPLSGTHRRVPCPGRWHWRAAIIGLPMFFEIGLVLLMPVMYLVSRRSQLSLSRSESPL